MAKNGPKNGHNGPKMIQNDQKMVKKWSKMFKNCSNWSNVDSKMVQNGHKWSKNCPNMVQKRSHISICDGFISSLSAAHHQFITSSWSVHHQFIISSSSVHHQFIISSSPGHCQFIVKLGPKNITQIGLRAEGAKANVRREGQWPKADSQKHKLDDQQIQLISPIMLPIMFPLFKSFHVVNYNQLCS